jgi:hypothetical protein
MQTLRVRLAILLPGLTPKYLSSVRIRRDINFIVVCGKGRKSQSLSTARRYIPRYSAKARGFRGCCNLLRNLEARVGIEPTRKGFADLSLTTWVPRPVCRHSSDNPRCTRGR